MIARSFLLLFSILFFHKVVYSSKTSTASFQVDVYNVENLFDSDGVSLYNDYKKEMYGRKELENKLDKICDILRKIGGKTGPDVILFQEIEVDQTPEKFPSAAEELLKEMNIRGMGPYNFHLDIILMEVTINGPLFIASPYQNFQLLKVGFIHLSMLDLF